MDRLAKGKRGRPLRDGKKKQLKRVPGTTGREEVGFGTGARKNSEITLKRRVLQYAQGEGRRASWYPRQYRTITPGVQ